jgi:hypothetical protein
MQLHAHLTFKNFLWTHESSTYTQGTCIHKDLWYNVLLLAVLAALAAMCYACYALRSQQPIPIPITTPTPAIEDMCPQKQRCSLYLLQLAFSGMPC